MQTNNPPSRFPRIFYALILVDIAVGIVLLCAALWPAPVRRQGFVISPDRLRQLAGRDGALPPALQQPLRLETRWPAWLRPGERGTVELSLGPAGDPGVVTAENVPSGDGTSGDGTSGDGTSRDGTSRDDTSRDVPSGDNVVVEAALDGPALSILPGETFQTPLGTGQTVRLRWTVAAAEDGAFPAEVWVHLRLVPRGGGNGLRIPVAQQSLEVTTWRVLGLTRSGMIWGGAGLLLLGLAAGAGRGAVLKEFAH